jgi:hypothetical protein
LPPGVKNPPAPVIAVSTHHALTRYPPWAVAASLVLLLFSQLRFVQPYFAETFPRYAFWICCGLLLSVIVTHALIAWLGRK